MKGAIIGDIVGSVYEWHNIKTKEFSLFSEKSRPTDDSVMTIAVGMALKEAHDEDTDIIETLTDFMQDYGSRYPHRGYGGKFRRWLRSSDPKPYNSWGNGACMRCSAAGMIAATPEKAFDLGMYTAAPTHNHPEGMKAAGITSMLIWYAREGMSKDSLLDIASKAYLIPNLDTIRPSYTFDVSCQGTMPVALAAFFESENFEDAIRNAISVGGDSDTIAAVTGSIADAFYGVPDNIWAEACKHLDAPLKKDVDIFYHFMEELDSNRNL